MKPVGVVAVVSIVFLGGFLGFVITTDNVSALSWNIEIASSVGSVGEWTSIVLDSNGYPHISHYDLSSYDLMYTRWTGSMWSTVIADSFDWVGRYSSLALDDNDYAHISYYDRFNEDLKYVRWDGTKWNIETVDSDPLSGRFTSIALNSSGFPRISYYDHYQNRLKYASWNGSAWNIEIVTSGGLYTSLELDANEYPHISYESNGLWYANWNGTAWKTERVDAALNVGRHTSLALDDLGYPHISYYHSDGADLRYAKWNGTAWSIETVDAAGGVGGYTSIDLDSNDYPQISYYESWDWGHLKFARWNGVEWTTETVDSADMVGKFTSMVVDANDQVHIAYYDNVNYDCKYAKGWPTGPWAPENLAATPGNARVDLTWDPPSSDGGYPITNYRIHRGTVSGGETFLEEIGEVLTYTDLGLTNGQIYYYEVSAVNLLGEGARSSEVSAVPATIPGAPTGLDATRGDKEVALNWNAPTDDGGSAVSNYAIYRGLTSGGESLLTTTGAVPGYVDTGLTNGVTYFYQVAAINGVGEGPNSTEVSALPATTPTEPLNLQETIDDQEVNLTWDAPSDNGGLLITNYRIHRALVSGSETFLVEIGNVTIYEDTGLTNGQKYFYEVSAVNPVGEGPKSNEVFGIPATIPGAPTDLAAERGNGEVSLTWTVPSDNGGSQITNFTVYRGTTSGGETLLAVFGMNWRYTDTGLTNGVTYFYKVTATNGIGEGPESNEASATPATYPSEPRNLQATAGNGEVNLAWEVPASDGGLAITNYKVFRRTSSGSMAFLVKVGNVLSYADTGLTNGVTYYYKVTVVSGFGESLTSNEANATPMNEPPVCVISTPADGSTIIGTISITGTSSDSDGVVQKVEVRIDDGSWIEAEGNTSWSLSWDSETVSNGLHTVIARSYDGEDYSTETSVTLWALNPTPDGEGGLDMLWIGIALLIVIISVVAAVAVALLIKKKGGSAQEKGLPKDRK
jgi:fibronectin type 3 domain-containing protein